MSPISGGDSGGVPPLPIPNREVKPACADGTAMQCGRVGSRLFLTASPEDRNIVGAFLGLLVGWSVGGLVCWFVGGLCSSLQMCAEVEICGMYRRFLRREER